MKGELALYGHDACMYCQGVLRAIEALGIEVEYKDVSKDRAARAELREARSRTTVPVLRIRREEGDEWMPESADIIRYLYEREGKTPPSGPGLQRIITGIMWTALAAGGFLPEYQAPLWLLACALGAGRSIVMGMRSGAPIHFGVGALFVLGCVSIGMRWAGESAFPWWYFAYGFVALLALLAVVQRLRRKRETPGPRL